MRGFCGTLLTVVVVLSICLAAAIAVAAIITNLANKWHLDEERPKLFAILNMLGVITKRNFEWRDMWYSAPIKSRCACASGQTDEDNNHCPPDDPCNPGTLPIVVKSQQ